MKPRLSTPLAVLFLVAIHALPAWAQADLPEGGRTTLWDLWKVGGIIMYPLLALCVSAVTLAIYGYRNTPEKKMLTPHLVEPLREALGKLDLREVQTLCRGTPSLLTNILAAGVERVGEDGTVDVASMEKAMEEASVEEAAAGLKSISYLSIIAQLAPMLGLLGTVTGMIKAFDAISRGGMGQPDKLAGNIGEAMVTTATGLIVGIPAMFAYFHLKGRYTSNVARLSRVLGNLLHRLSEALRRTGPSAVGVGDTI